MYNVNDKKIIYKDYILNSNTKYTGVVTVQSIKEYTSLDDDLLITSDLCPYDMVFIWGNLDNNKVLEKSEYTQKNRWYYYSVSKNVIDSREYIINHSSNNHIIPANEDVYNKLVNISIGDKVYIESYLVDFKNKDGKIIESSKSFSDEGGTACEIHYVTKLLILPKIIKYI